MLTSGQLRRFRPTQASYYNIRFKTTRFSYCSCTPHSEIVEEKFVGTVASVLHCIHITVQKGSEKTEQANADTKINANNNLDQYYYYWHCEQQAQELATSCSCSQPTKEALSYIQDWEPDQIIMTNGQTQLTFLTSCHSPLCLFHLHDVTRPFDFRWYLPWRWSYEWTRFLQFSKQNVAFS